MKMRNKGQSESHFIEGEAQGVNAAQSASQIKLSIFSFSCYILLKTLLWLHVKSAESN